MKTIRECTSHSSGSGSNKRTYTTCKDVPYYRNVYNVTRVISSFDPQTAFAAFDSGYGAWFKWTQSVIDANETEHACLIPPGEKVDVTLAVKARIEQGDTSVAVLDRKVADLREAQKVRTIAAWFWAVLWSLIPLMIIATVVYFNREDWCACLPSFDNNTQRSYTPYELRCKESRVYVWFLRF